MIRVFVLFRCRNEPESPYWNCVKSEKPSSTVPPPPQGTVFRANGVVRWLYTRDELYIMRRRNERRAVNPSDRAKDKNKTLVYTHNVCSVKGEDRFRLRAGQSERARAFKSFRSSCRTALFLPIVLLYCSARSYITA